MKEFDFVSFIPNTARSVGVAAILVRPNVGIYLTKRKSNLEYGCPGGKIDHNDLSTEDSIRRELLEETGLNINENRLFWLGSQKVTTKVTDFTCWYLIILNENEIPQNIEPEKHNEWQIFKIKEALKLPLFCGTKQTLEKLPKKLINFYYMCRDEEAVNFLRQNTQNI